ncbi:MAG: hypothetical protein U9Q66_03495 [Patescibacteria group bacterium]|nr:hypothetical protein [Patescibacteria group bacterium]
MISTHFSHGFQIILVIFHSGFFHFQPVTSTETISQSFTPFKYFPGIKISFLKSLLLGIKNQKVLTKDIFQTIGNFLLSIIFVTTASSFQLNTLIFASTLSQGIAFILLKPKQKYPFF